MRFFVLLLILASCVSDPSKQSRTAYLLEEEDNTLSEVIEDITILLDLYPINGEIDKEKLSYELQRPRQFFSSGSNNEIRLHKLGQIRWLYVESLPSSVWPILNQYIENEKKNPIYTLCDVYGIGTKKAKELISKNITSIDSIKKNVDQLNNVQKIGLKYYDEINEKIHREE